MQTTMIFEHFYFVNFPVRNKCWRLWSYSMAIAIKIISVIYAKTSDENMPFWNGMGDLAVEFIAFLPSIRCDCGVASVSRAELFVGIILQRMISSNKSIIRCCSLHIEIVVKMRSSRVDSSQSTSYQQSSQQTTERFTLFLAWIWMKFPSNDWKPEWNFGNFFVFFCCFSFVECKYCNSMRMWCEPMMWWPLKAISLKLHKARWPHTGWVDGCYLLLCVC